MRFLFWKALIGLMAFDLLEFGRDFSRMHRFVRSWQCDPRVPSDGLVDHICFCVNIACVWYPKQVLCLQRAAVTTCLLRSCGVSAEMVMGAQVLPFTAHAWTEVNGHAINERNDVNSIYQVWQRC
jgi:hypothetical protein